LGNIPLLFFISSLERERERERERGDKKEEKDGKKYYIQKRREKSERLKRRECTRIGS
jgi:hypothetical protein